MFYTNAVICKTYHFIPLLIIYIPSEKLSCIAPGFFYLITVSILSQFIIFKIVGKPWCDPASGFLILVIDSPGYGLRVQKIEAVQSALIHRIPFNLRIGFANGQ